MIFDYSSDLRINNNDVNHKELESKKFSGSLSFVSGSISHYTIYGYANTSYTKIDDIQDTLLFDSASVIRLIDLERELRDYEKKYKMSSDDFYKKWKSDQSFDKSEFNDWADTCRLLNYAKTY